VKKLIPVVLLILLFTAGCDLAGINLTTTTQSAAINSFGASPATISAGGSSTLSWTVTGATTVNIDQGIGNVALSGSRVVMPTSTTVYTLTATSPTGISVTATAQVIVAGTTPTPTPPPTPSPTPSGVPVINYFTASPSSISPGDFSTLSWDVDNASLVSIDNGIGLVISTGARVVYPAMSTSYTLTATNSSGSSTKTTTVLVSQESSSFDIISVFASVDPSFYSGNCPTTVTSNGVIIANGPGTVSYRWEDSEGGIKPTESVYFSSAGSQSVSTSWPIGLSGTFWVRLRVLSPSEVLSNQATFTLSCSSSPTGGWTGTWDTNWGTMVLTQTGDSVSGTYTWDNGHIQGTVTGDTLSGIWSEEPSYTTPYDAGTFVFILSPDANIITGNWRYGFDGEWEGSWSGTRISD